MTTDKTIARLVGAFYIMATVAGIVGLTFSDPILTDSDYLTKISDHETQVRIGALLELVMAVAVVGIAVAVYPILKKAHTSVALGYLSARLVEGVIFVIDTISLLMLLTLSQEFIDAGSPEASTFYTSGELLLSVRDWSGHVILDVAVFPLSALLLYYPLYRLKLVPRWLSGWGLVGAALYWAAGFLVLFDLIGPLSSAQIILQAPLGLQEMVFAVWLIVKGFNLSAFASEPA